MPSSIASRLQRSSSSVPARRAGDQAEARDDQPLEEDLHQEDLLLEHVGLEEHVRELVEVRVALALAADLADQLQPRLGVARLVLHHRRVVEARLRVRRRLSSCDAISQAKTSAWSCCMTTERQMSRRRACRSGEPFPSGTYGISPHGMSSHLPLLVLGEVVEAEDARVAAAVVLRRDGLGVHRGDLIPAPGRIAR